MCQLDVTSWKLDSLYLSRSLVETTAPVVWETQSQLRRIFLGFPFCTLKEVYEKRSRSLDLIESSGVWKWSGRFQQSKRGGRAERLMAAGDGAQLPATVAASRSVDKGLEEAAASGALNLSNRKLKEFPRSARNYDLSDITHAGQSAFSLSSSLTNAAAPAS